VTAAKRCRASKVKVTTMELGHLVGSVNSAGIYSRHLSLALDTMLAASHDLHVLAAAVEAEEGDR